MMLYLQYNVKVKDPKWADDFDKMLLLIQDESSKWYDVNLSVQRTSLEVFRDSWDKKEGTFVLDWNHPNGLHCVYAKKWMKSMGRVKCMNSWSATEKEPEILPMSIKFIYLIKLRLKCTDDGKIIETKGKVIQLVACNKNNSFQAILGESEGTFGASVGQSHPVFRKSLWMYRRTMSTTQSSRRSPTWRPST